MNENDETPSEQLLNAKGARAYILALARSFPCLRSKIAHLTPATWDVDEFMKSSGPWSTGEKHCARFIANVWNQAHAKEKKWRFDVVDFASSADPGNRRALMAWLSHPVWP